MDIFKSLDIKKRVGLIQIVLSLILLSLFIPLTDMKISWVMLVLFGGILLFRYKPVPLRKFSYLSLTPSIPIVLYFLYGPINAAFWTFVFLLIADTVFRRDIFQAFINGAAYTLTVLIAGGIFGTGITDNITKMVIFYPVYQILLLVIFYLSEFISRKISRKETLYILSWEAFYFILVVVTSYLTYNIIKEPGVLKILLFIPSFLILRYYIRKISENSIEGSVYRDLVKIQKSVIKKSLDETLKAVISHSKQYIDWETVNIGRITDDNRIMIIYNTDENMDEGFSTDIEEGIAGTCIRQAEPIIVRDTTKSDEYISLKDNIKSEMAIPLIYEEDVIGLMDFEHNIAGAFSDKEVEYAKFFASQLATALQTALSLRPLVDTSENLTEFTDETRKKTIRTGEEMESIRNIMEDVISGAERQIVSLIDVENAMSELLISHEDIKSIREEISDGMVDFGSTIENSEETVRNNLSSLEKISESTREVNRTVKKLTQLSGNVMEFASSSKRIAEDTALLALNASIEASRASGSSGSFTVIADEINKLAKNASDNSDKISENAETIKGSVNELSSKTDEVVNSTKNIEDASSSIMDQFSNIKIRLENLEQSINKTIEVSKKEIKNIEKLNESIEKSLDIGEDNISYIEEVNNTIKNQSDMIKDLNRKTLALKESTEKMKEVVKEFRLTINI